MSTAAFGATFERVRADSAKQGKADQIATLKRRALSYNRYTFLSHWAPGLEIDPLKHDTAEHTRKLLLQLARSLWFVRQQLHHHQPGHDWSGAAMRSNAIRVAMIAEAATLKRQIAGLEQASE